MDLPFFKNRNEVDFLVERRFPDAMTIRGRAASLTRFPGDEKTAREMTAYANKLQVMPEAQFQALLAEEKRKEGIELEARATREEAGRFFNQLDASADFSHWSKKAYWTLDEATALSFGKTPDVVNWVSINGHVDRSPFAARYAQLRDLVERARIAQHLSDPISPGVYIAWAKRNGIDFPADLEVALVARGWHFADWKALYEQEVRSKNEIRNEVNAQLASLAASRDELQKVVDDLRVQLDAAKKASLPAKERDSLVRLVYGMAVDYHGYDPEELRSKIPGQIASGLSRFGISLHPDTIRKYLKEGFEICPPIEIK
jgi:hypothetical protein